MGGWQLHQYINKLQYGVLAQMGERLPCKQEVTGSIPVGSTIFLLAQRESACAEQEGIGSNPIWEEINELLVIEATNDNAQIEITHMGLFQGFV